MRASNESPEDAAKRAKKITDAKEVVNKTAETKAKLDAEAIGLSKEVANDPEGKGDGALIQL